MTKRVTALKRQVRRRDRVSVFLDGEFAFGVQETVAATLSIGQELTEADIAELEVDELVASGYEKALIFLSYRPRSRREVERRLARYGLEEPQIEQVISRLQRAGLVDDSSFAEYWVENRESFRPRGRRALYAELRAKGVDRHDIEPALDGLDESASAQRAAEKRTRRWKHLDEQSFSKKMLGYLQRRGFGYRVAKETVDRCWEVAQREEERD